MPKVEFIKNTCEWCGSYNEPQEMYVDMRNHMWIVVCPLCFIKKNKNQESAYYKRVKEVIGNRQLLKSREFDKVKNSVIAIADSFPYLKPEGSIFTPEEKESLLMETVKKFSSSEKIKNKFILVDMKAKTADEKLPEGVAHIVSIVAKVKFKTYMDYLEHEMYMQFRRENRTVFR